MSSNNAHNNYDKAEVKKKFDPQTNIIINKRKSNQVKEEKKNRNVNEKKDENINIQNNINDIRLPKNFYDLSYDHHKEE